MNSIDVATAARIAQFIGAERWAMRSPDGQTIGFYSGLCPIGGTMLIPDVDVDPKASQFVREHPESSFRSLVALPFGRHGVTMLELQYAANGPPLSFNSPSFIEKLLIARFTANQLSNPFVGEMHY